MQYTGALYGMRKKQRNEQLDAILRAYQAGLISSGEAITAMGLLVERRRGKKWQDKEALYYLIRKASERDIS